MANAFLPNSEKGGVAFQVHYLANALVERGHAVTMFTCSPAFDECRYSVRRFRHLPGLPKRLFAFAQAGGLARSDFSHFDVIHTHGDNYLMWDDPSQVRTFHGSAKDEARAATTARRKMYYRATSHLESLGARVATINVGVSEATRASVGNVHEIIPCGVDLRRFMPGQKSEKPSILFVGGMEGRKRGNLLLQAFRSYVRPQYPEAELWLVADGSETSSGVHSFGKIPLERLAELYRRAWIFSMPSSYEGFGVPYVEAMASGTTVVTTPNPGANEVLGHGTYGAVVSEERLGPTLVDLIANAERRDAFASSGLLRARHYDWAAVSASYERVYLRARADRSTFRSRRFHRAEAALSDSR